MENKATGGPIQLVMAPCCLCGLSDHEAVGIGEDFEYRTTADTFVAVRCLRCG